MSEALRLQVRANLDSEALSDPFERFSHVFARAKEADPKDFNAMCLSTVDDDGRPSSRFVLLKEFDARGFVFYTNLESRKGRQLRAHPDVALAFYWGALEEQVRIEGVAEPVTDTEADAYFGTRPRGSQLGAWASTQSSMLASRSELEERLAEAERRFEGRDVSRPPHWSGRRVVPRRIEFWVGMPSRLHHRTQYDRTADGWSRRILAP
ncbi:MAG: pyridoxamine 5-phosphate oxidase [Pseudomonadota bacterium]|jgi:pyridoxamine 5'-phosphate oxidase